MPEDPIVARLWAAGCVFAEDEAALLRDAAGGDEGRLAVLVERRAAGEPLEHIVGWAELAGVRVLVGPGGFVPRRRTAALAAQAERDLPIGARVLDLCCGSGAIAVVIATHRPDVVVHACDIDPVAVDHARRNLEPLGGHVYRGDLFAALPAAIRFDLITANVPYVPSEAVAFLPGEARDHEPRATLDGGPDGLDVYRRVMRQAPSWLRPGGRVLVEIGGSQVDVAVSVAVDAGLTATAVHDEEWETTVLVATQPA